MMVVQKDKLGGTALLLLALLVTLGAIITLAATVIIIVVATFLIHARRLVQLLRRPGFRVFLYQAIAVNLSRHIKDLMAPIIFMNFAFDYKIRFDLGT
jgi:hypothetical protein